MSYSTAYPPKMPGIGDFVRCVSDAGWNGGPFPLILGHVYMVRAVEGAGDFDALAMGAGPRLYLHGAAPAFLACRFEIVAQAPANDDPCPAAAIPQKMARVMRERAAATGSCDLDDLARAGFSTAEIIEYRDEALRLAGPVGDLLPGEVA